MNIFNLNFRSIFLLSFTLFSSLACLSQSKQGNIVEYFGKEKVNEISEGKLLHVFREGLAVRVPTDRTSGIDFPSDPVFAKFLQSPSYEPSDGANFGKDQNGEAMIWSNIAVDSTNTFSDRALRSSYVYLTYESDNDRIVIFEASGHSVALVNGFPHEGDHYDFGWSLIPVKLKKGSNTFVLKVGRFPRIRARMIEASSKVVFTGRDMTLPDILSENNTNYYGAVRVVNASENFLRNISIKCGFQDASHITSVIDLPPLSVTKIPFETAKLANLNVEKIELDIELIQGGTESLASKTISLNVRSRNKHHKRTFISDIDHSVQYYSVAPTLAPDSANQALFLSVHGASVEATNQARAYKQKDWGTLVAPTNRRPFGFAWEDWGRIDAMEVLTEAKRIYEPDPSKIYLTGHSMGGHGTWYLGATYPDQFAAIAPCAGYPDLLGYRNSFTRRLKGMSANELKRFGMTPEMVEEMSAPKVPTSMEQMVQRAGNPSRTLSLKRNYLHHGVYVLHGEKDNVVPTFIARDMRQTLGGFHNDFTYYEYPGGTHWYGDHSVDWPPLFDFFKARSIPEGATLKKLEFYTASPGVSATSHFVTIYQQADPFEVSSFEFDKEKRFQVGFKNTRIAGFDFTSFDEVPDTLYIDNQAIATQDQKEVFIKKSAERWSLSSEPNAGEKGPHRSGGFKDAFRNQMVFVYGTAGSPEENKWNKMKAMFDAETFGYRANGRVEVIEDKNFTLAGYKDRNVIIYGNRDGNSAWDLLLKECPIIVRNGQVDMGGKEVSGDEYGLYFTYKREDSDIASVGVVAATGLEGMKAAYANHYLVNGTSFPDLILFDSTVLESGISGIKCAGFFGNDWTVEGGDWEWR